MQEAQIIPRATTSRPWAKEEPLTVKLKRPRVYAELWQHFLSAYSGSYTCHPPKLTLVTSIYSTQEGTEAQRSSATRLRGRRATMWRWERELRCVPCPPAWSHSLVLASCNLPWENRHAGRKLGL